MHADKYTKSATGHMFKHYERARDEKGEYVKFGNRNIDLSRTHLNYNLAPDHNQLEYLKERLSQVKCQNRKDVNVFCDWVITAPKELRKENQKEFFDLAYKFMSERYGEQNVISAYVHMDETTPHMHFCFIPVYYDKKKDIYKVSAKQLLNKIELKCIHPQFQQYLDRCAVWGRDVNILNGATAGGNKTVAELKAEKYTEFYERKIEENRKEREEVYKELCDFKEEALKKKIRLQGEIEICKNELIEVNNGINNKREELKICQNELYKVNNSIQANNSTLKALEGEIENKKKERDFFKLRRERAEKELNVVLEQIGELQHKYEQMKMQPPEVKTIEKVVEVKKEVPVKVPVEVPVEVVKEIPVARYIDITQETFNKALNAFSKAMHYMSVNDSDLMEKFFNENKDSLDFLQIWKTCYPESNVRVAPLDRDKPGSGGR